MKEAERETQYVSENQLTNAEKDLQKLFYLSYRYSQGNATLQNELFQDIIYTGFVDTALIVEQIPDFILALSPPKHHILLGKETQKESFKLDWDQLRRVALEPIKEHQRSDIFSEMIITDYLFQGKERPERTNEWTESDSNQDPHASFLRKYALHGAKSGHTAYDELFRDLRTMMIDLKMYNAANKTNITFNKDTPKYLSELEKLWEGNHPGEKFWDGIEV